MNQLHEKGVSFASIQEKIGTTTSGRKLILYVFGALMEFERELTGKALTPG